MQSTTLTTDAGAAATAVAGGIIGAIIVGILVFYVLTVIASWKIFEKAGEKGWKALIPIYNTYIMYKITNMTGWFWATLAASLFYSIVFSASGLNTNMTTQEAANINWGQNPLAIVAVLVLLVVSIWGGILYAIRLAKAFNKGAGFVVGLIFLPNIFWLILGFGKAKYDKKRIK